jgi:hypothetical protein
MRYVLLLSTIALLAACASTPSPAPAALLDLSSPTGSPAPQQARYYADCVTASTDAATYRRAGNTILFHCAGEPAQRSYDGLAAWTAANNLEFAANGRTVRVTVSPERYLSVLEHCLWYVL